MFQLCNADLLFINIKALNEWESFFAGGCCQKLDVKPGAVLANELKHNACKLAKGTVEKLLTGSDIVKFGYISRYVKSQNVNPWQNANELNV